MQNSRLRWVSVMALMGLMASAACSGGPLPVAGADAPSTEAVADLSDTTPGDEAADDKPSDGKKKPGPKGSPSAGTDTGSTAGTTTGGTSVSASGETTTEEQQAERSEELSKGLQQVDMWPASTEQMGFTDDKITLCVHAALTFAEVFDTRPEDIDVYWEWVNDHGGVYGRQVEMTTEDDAYRPDQAVAAAERCKAKSPFMLLGGIGFDQIPAVRVWNEQPQNHLLYIHHMAREDSSKKYSFSFMPSVERAGTFAAKWILKQHSDKNVGVIWRQSEAWEPGHTTFRATVDAAGKELVADLPVQKDQTLFTQQIAALQSAGAETVFVWENALAAIELVRQAKQQDYHPTWVVFPFQLMTDLLGEDSLSPPFEGIAFWPAYAPGVTTGTFAKYADEIKRFEAAQAQYGEAETTNDLLWMTWLGWKQIHQLLLDCGPNCTRDRIVTLMLNNRWTSIAPECRTHFSDTEHAAGLDGNIFVAADVPGYEPPAWTEIFTCVPI